MCKGSYQEYLRAMEMPQLYLRVVGLYISGILKGHGNAPVVFASGWVILPVPIITQVVTGWTKIKLVS